MAIKVAMSDGSVSNVPNIDLADFKNIWQSALSRNELIDLDGQALVHPGHIIAAGEACD